MILSKSGNGWELHTITNGKLSCENFYLEDADEIDRVERGIRQRFGNAIDEEGIMVTWDNWSGTFIMQMPGKNTETSDDLIKEIYEFLAGSDSV